MFLKDRLLEYYFLITILIVTFIFAVVVTIVVLVVVNIFGRLSMFYIYR